MVSICAKGSGTGELKMNSKSKSLLVLLAFLLGLTSALAGTETRTVETTRVISASPQEVLDAFVVDGDLKAWWNVSRSLVERKQGGVGSITWENWGEEQTQHAWIGVIEEIAPNRLLIGHLVMIEPDMPLFGPMQLEISVKPAAGGTSVTVSHRGYQYGDHWDTIHDLVVNGWDHVLGDLEIWAQQEY
jgi:uncharacterized protein YndB with AHSA1/START domain